MPDFGKLFVLKRATRYALKLEMMPEATITVAEGVSIFTIIVTIPKNKADVILTAGGYNEDLD